MKDALEYYNNNPVEEVTVATDACIFGECDGSGFRWFKDWRVQMEIAETGTFQRFDKDGKRRRPEWQEPCRCYASLKASLQRKKKLTTAGMPPIFEDAFLNNFSIKYAGEGRGIAQVAKKMAMNYVKDFDEMSRIGKGLYLYSEIKGSGKTRLAMSIANELMTLGHAVVIIKATNISKEVRKTFKKDTTLNEIDIINEFKQAKVLVIDDIAAEKPTEFVGDLLLSILDYRLENKLVTLITSNKTFVEMDTHEYSEGRIASRMKKMCVEINLPEESMRARESDYENQVIEEKLLKGVDW